MFGKLSKKELKNISLEAEQKEFQINKEKFCTTAADVKNGLQIAILLVKNPLWKWILSLAVTLVEALEKKIGCNADN